MDLEDQRVTLDGDLAEITREVVAAVVRQVQAVETAVVDAVVRVGGRRRFGHGAQTFDAPHARKAERRLAITGPVCLGRLAVKGMAGPEAGLDLEGQAAVMLGP